MPATVRHNMGTVQEHVILSCVAAWLCEQGNLEDGPVQYIDTHTMAPFGAPIGRDFSCLLHLANRLHKKGLPAAAPSGAAAYFATVLDRYAAHLADGQPRWYPTHFLHVWHAVSTQNAHFNAYLFENDAEGAGRRELLQQFLANHGLGDAFNGVLAPLPGTFRDPDCWPAPAERAGCAVLITSDPLEMEPRNHHGGSYMHLNDIARLGRLVAERYQSAPSLLAHVLFCLANPGNDTRYTILTRDVSKAWHNAFAANGVAHCCGIKWGSFLVFVGVRTLDGEGIDGAFLDLKARIRRSLGMAHDTGALTVFDEAGKTDDEVGELRLDDLHLAL